MTYSPFNLTGKVALITGGNGGIGLGMAEALAQAGASLVIWGTNDKKNTDAEAALTKHGGKVSVQHVNVANEAEVAQGMKDAVARMGRVDSVFANAGVGGGAKSFFDISADNYRKVMSVNLDGVFYTLREATRHMRERAAGGDRACRR